MGYQELVDCQAQSCKGLQVSGGMHSRETAAINKGMMLGAQQKQGDVHSGEGGVHVCDDGGEGPMLLRGRNPQSVDGPEGDVVQRARKPRVDLLSEIVDTEREEEEGRLCDMMEGAGRPGIQKGREGRDVSAAGAPGGYFLLVRRRVARRLVPVYHLLCGEEGLREEMERVERDLEELTLQGLVSWEGEGEVEKGLIEEMERETRMCMQDCWEGRGPEEGEEVRRLEEEMREEEGKVEELMDRVQEEREERRVCLKEAGLQGPWYEGKAQPVRGQRRRVRQGCG